MRRISVGLVKRSGRRCTKCKTELIYRPGETDEKLRYRHLCVTCEEKQAQKHPLLRPVPLRTHRRAGKR